MTCNLYRNNSAPNTLDKNLTALGGSVTVRNYEAVNDISGYLYMSNSSNNTGANYLKLNNKYYFIGPREYLTNGLMRMFIEEDVLQTFKDQIKALPVVVGRNKVWKATEMYDAQLHSLQRTAVYVKKLGTFSYDMSSKILVTVG